MGIDYKKLGVKIGLEIHQQLDTHKLFCSCPSILRNDPPDIRIRRRLRAVAGELGEVDIAAKEEEIRRKKFIYEAYSDTTCLVELDEEPPHQVNEEALAIAVEIARMLHMKIFDELCVMRKVVIDGSNVSGFQRTMLVAENGYIECSFGKVRISLLALEEEAARKISEGEEEQVFRLDRLGIPLVEIRTEPDMSTPKEARECAERIGLLLRMTGKVKRGIGTIRQDVNVSVRGKGRVEIKGVQDLRHLEKIIENEILRQLSLDELSQRYSHLLRHKFECKDISHIFTNTKCEMIRKTLNSGGKVLCMKIPDFRGLMKWEIQPNKRLAQEILEYISSFSRIKGFIHRDELPGYGISETEVLRIEEHIKSKENDNFILIFGKEEEAIEALRLAYERLIELIKYGGINEVRGVKEDLTTRFMRKLPGASRMYPETDLPPVKIKREMLTSRLPETPEEKIKKFIKLGLSPELAQQIVRSEKLEWFEELVKEFKGVRGSLIAKLLFNSLENLKKKGLDVSQVRKEDIKQLLRLLSEDKIVFEACELVLEEFLKTGEEISEIIVKRKLTKLSKCEVRKIIRELFAGKNLKELGLQRALNIAMKELRGRAEYPTVEKCVRELFKQ
ncbi:MAG: Glu-tRNA(Gln) amidotransferase subunit GatE [Candidatus Nanoarchaeia archaeon]|nr:Glu-tRNA(Gln) amidotransferase subunit GatE [Candidatus Haiyanarchaeum thermophilum]MCW1302957.1 Glu-tRNA(Gln) amidotransferase subunit GatE [Candidatus Haiyanarchaeum thermophilum]MCW1303635.1 Glu-tRNA(Gln) amidotransferase subunit GatE [Candidatus Haiyanarchaeum thermophilum]MCW1306316.1 Glu-tRNA(Gln) amidotransferase subunit GatE [Candidatus Haiyanarchaeum thermophilum]MCW1307174.1 Glu-tRNA(Gln) amidotransferase subunit GatE [Candidatus Haiyanarchaeum thermophilum]